MTTTPAKSSTGEHKLKWLRFLQFSMRTLLIVTTLAAIGCWWYLRPELRQEQVGQSSLSLRRDIRKVDFDPFNSPRDETVEGYGGGGMGEPFGIKNVGRWQLFAHGGDLLVYGRYRNGLQHGKWTTYHVNGRKAAEGMMRAGKKVGVWRTWHEDGRIIEEVAF
jgi:hypothetical protein